MLTRTIYNHNERRKNIVLNPKDGGFLLGLLYILIISVVAIVLGQVFSVASTASLTTAALCIGGGLLGGMLS